MRRRTFVSIELVFTSSTSILADLGDWQSWRPGGTAQHPRQRPMARVLPLEGRPRVRRGDRRLSL